jgi:molybdenum cofactor cytidylyltransferase
VFTLVDHPVISAGTLSKLFESTAPIAIPRFQGKRGHPVLMQRLVFEEYLAEPVTATVRDVIDRHAAWIDYIEVEDPGISDDIDNPQLYENLLAREAGRV